MELFRLTALALCLAGCITVRGPSGDDMADAGASGPVTGSGFAKAPTTRPDASAAADAGQDSPAAPADPKADPSRDACDDADGDGQCDSVDPCPVDDPNDSDHDGQCESSDPCPKSPLDDRDSDGSCDDVDPCPQDAANDADKDGVCAPDDHCVGSGAEDSDKDRACDGDDKCPGFDDRVDADKDGVADGCDKCPARSDADADGNGYPDACDIVLVSAVATRNYSAPITALYALYEARQPDNINILYASVKLTAPISESFDITTNAVGELEAQLSLPRTVGSATDGHAIVRCEVDWNNGVGTGSLGSGPYTFANTIRRARLFGSVVGATFNVTLELRGY